jgi:hypothetical protein
MQEFFYLLTSIVTMNQRDDFVRDYDALRAAQNRSSF